MDLAAIGPTSDEVGPIAECARSYLKTGFEAYSEQITNSIRHEQLSFQRGQARKRGGDQGDRRWFRNGGRPSLAKDEKCRAAQTTGAGRYEVSHARPRGAVVLKNVSRAKTAHK